MHSKKMVIDKISNNSYVGKPIRVAHIMGKWRGGGVESVVLNYYRNIDRNKIQFDFFFDSDSDIEDIPIKKIEALGGKVIIIPPYQKLFKYRSFLKKELSSKKYLIVHSHISTLSIIPLSAAKSVRVPIRIAHSHSTTNKNEKIKNFIKNVLRKFSKVYPNVYFACSELAGRYQFGDKTFDSGKVHVINNAIDLNKFKYEESTRKTKRKELGFNDDTFVIGHIGRFVEQKNHSFLIDIFNKVHEKNKNSVLVLVGHGPLMEQTKKKVHDLGLEDCVMFLGQRNDVTELYQAFDTFVLPSLYEGLPVVGVEAQACGLKCFLSSEMTVETKILNSTVFIGLDKTDDEWAEIILDDRDYYNRGNVRQEFIDKSFEITSEARKLTNLYLKLLEKCD